MPFPRWLATFNRFVTNPLMRRIAAPSVRRLGAFGRTSGKEYCTPLNAFPTDDGFVCALTYGSTADGVKNIQAAGGAMLVYDDHPIRFTEPSSSSGPGPGRPSLGRFTCRFEHSACRSICSCAAREAWSSDGPYPLSHG